MLTADKLDFSKICLARKPKKNEDIAFVSGQRFAMLELKSAVSTILRKFELQPVTKPSDLQFISDLVLRNNAPVYVSFINRNKSK